MLNAEKKPTYKGWRKACEVLYKVYRKEQPDCKEETFLEHVFEDEYFTKLNVKRVCRFFIWLGIVKAGEGIDLGPRVERKERRADVAEDVKTESGAVQESEDGGENATTISVAVSPSEERLRDINIALQEATKARDAKAIRQLMTERRELQLSLSHRGGA